MPITKQIPPRQLVNFINEITTNEKFRNELETNTKEVLAAYGFDIPADLIPEKVELPSMEYLMESVSEYLKKEHFAFPAEKSIQMGFPLAFAITVVFVFVPANMSANENIRQVA